ncbi:MAG TPA: hypothetical protein VI790_02395 [Candidatus Nanoarchaeia archaeon]|nr:hypothetical protein [Candidatus Nanoarchaeia archaeon]
MSKDSYYMVEGMKKSLDDLRKSQTMLETKCKNQKKELERLKFVDNRFKKITDVFKEGAAKSLSLKYYFINFFTGVLGAITYSVTQNFGFFYEGDFFDNILFNLMVVGLVVLIFLVGYLVASYADKK